MNQSEVSTLSEGCLVKNFLCSGFSSTLMTFPFCFLYYCFFISGYTVPFVLSYGIECTPKSNACLVLKWSSVISF